MDRSKRSTIAAVTLAMAAVAWSSGAHATSLKFEMQGDDNYTWTMDSDPTPTEFTAGGAWGIAGSPGAPGDALNFFNLSENGGLNAVTFLNGPVTEIFDYSGPQVYSGLESAPHFAVGVFTFAKNVLTGNRANEILRISATPIPAALPLFASALGGLGFVGWRRKKGAAAA